MPGVPLMFAVALIFITLGLWALLACLLDWDSCLGVIDLRAAGAVVGDEVARWSVGAGGAALMLAGIFCAL